MMITIEVVEGPLAGQTFEITAGTKIGRSRADINLKDGKVSSLHAEVRTKSDDPHTLVLVDLGSTNGIKVNGKKVKSIDLRSGDQFQLGASIIKIKLVENQSPGLSDWRRHLLRMASTVYSFGESGALPVAAINPPLILRFTQGPQSGSRFYFGYGPRKIGYLSAEHKIQDPASGKLSFQISPSGKGGVIIESADQGILLNGSPVASDQLKMGDQIAVGDTVMEVEFDASHE